MICKNSMSILKEIKKYKKHEQLVLLCSRSSLDQEVKDYIQELIKTPGINWYEFLGITMINRVNGVVYKNIKDMYDVPRYVDYFMKMAYLEQKERTRIHREEIIKVSELFEKNNIRHAFLKGAVLNTIIYNPGDRISNDTDVMINIEDTDKAVELLKQEGYIQGEVKNGILVPATKKEILFARLNTYELVPMNKPVDDRYLPFHELDINYRLGNDSSQEEAIKLLERTEIINGNGYGIRSLPLEEFLIFLCIHHYREAVMIFKIAYCDDLTLYKYMDIHFLLSLFESRINWGLFKDKAKMMNRIKDVYYTLYTTEQLYPETISEEKLNMFKPEDISYLNEYRGRDNSDEVYTWKQDFAHRVFSYDRQLEALENIGEEHARYWSIRNSIKGNN